MREPIEPATMLRNVDRGTAWSAVAFGIAVLPCMWLADTELAQKLTAADLPGDLDKAIQVAEVFAHGAGVIAILVTLWWIDIDRRRAIQWAAVMTLVSSLAANALKNVFSRVRPHAGEAVDGLDSWLPIFHGSFWDSTQRSFPSGHSATAVGLAVGLSLVYPRGRILFGLFAGLACLQRLVSGAHYPSDVLAGVAIALLCCSLLIRFVPRG